MILKKQATRISVFTHKLLVLVATLCCSTSIIGEAGSSSAWLLNSNLEREETLASPARIGRQRAPQVFNAYYPSTNELNEYELFQQQQQQQNSDLFKCVDPTQGLFERFAVQYNRTFTRGGSNLVERQLLFDTTLRRTILLNRIVQNEIRNASNYQRKPKIGNYHFVTPMGEDNFALWYADITDCELGLIKKIVFDIFDLIDKNELEIAYLVAHEKSRLLPLFNEDGFEQLANILLVRLYDRFEEDKKMFQLFQWPLYMKKLAAYAYNRQQVSQPNFNAKLSLITYAYPSYFKDIRYNQQAINRTGDNLIVHHEHEKFNKQLARRISSIQERNRRLAIFRQHWTAINLLNDDKRWNDVKLEPDWQRTQQYQPDLSSVNAKLQQQDDGSYSSAPISFAPSPNDSRFKQTSFSDLTDAEFVAYLTNDFSLLENNQESAKFLDANFPIRPLTREFRDEIGAELELRKLMQLPKFQQQQQEQSQSLLPAAVMQKRPTYSLARQVVDELIGDVGLPIGPASEDNISEQEHFKVFNEVKNYFDKNYQPQKAAAGGIRGAGLTETDLLDEQQRRYERFKQNYGRFKAWFKKENWNIDNKRLIPMLRLADMSWQDIKLSLFKICCLAQPTLDALSATNSSIRYLVSNDFMCQPLHMDERLDFGLNSNQQPTIGGARSNQQERLQSETKAMRDSVALELYYYYSVHFNKHQSDAETLARRLAIFKHNIDHIRKHSCIRGLSLYTSLRTKNFDSLNTIDVLDPRRSYTDDINLDRFRYFTIPDLSSPTANADESSTEQFVARESNDFTFSSISRADASRAGVSYRREPFFSSVLEQTERQPSYPRPLADSDYTYADRLTVESQDYTKSAQKYRQLAVHKVYDLVMQGYSDCKKALDGIDVDISEVPPRQCVANSLGDQAVNSYLNLDSPYSRRQQLLSLKNDSCGLYWQGLQSWSEGLLRQDVNSPRLIQIARC